MPRLNSNSMGCLAKLTASLLTNFRSFENLGNRLVLAVEAFGDLPNPLFSEEWVKRIHIPKKTATKNGIAWFERVHPKCGSSSECWETLSHADVF